MERTARKQRSDALRNRERLLLAAKSVFAEGGADAGLDAVARRAGLGIGTLYRHFPAREALYEAVYQREVDDLVTLADRLAQEEEPIAALRRWVRAAVDLVATKKGMVAALAIPPKATSAISARSTERLTGAADRLVQRAVAAGALRPEVSGAELFLALVGMSMLHDRPGWQASIVKLVEALVDGFRTKA